MRTNTGWKSPCLHLALALAMAVSLGTLPARAQTDEIQVYDAEIEPPGIFNLMIHSNFTPLGRTTAAFPDAIIADHSFNGTAEWAYGVTPWFEQGLYLPVYTFYSTNQGTTLNGFKLRELFVRPHAHDHKLFYGANFEFSVNANYWEERRITSEIRPIIGLHLHPVDLIYNPILDTDYRGGIGGLEYNPGGRVAYNLNENWALALEEYDGFGQLHDFVPLHQQFHEVWAVMDHASSKALGINVEAGIGLGLTAGSDRITLKLMLSRNLNSRRWRP
ncbi:MAG TPA: hypothetical protein VL155_08965 [Terriglobales bacterium]|nr:hypothetical protein [Terriglobales bacterium]